MREQHALETVPPCADSPAEIPRPEPGLTFETMLRRAEGMRPALRERQQSCEEQGRLPEATHRDFLDAGFYRVVQPGCFGGYEFSITNFVRLLVEVSRGCADSGWVLSLIASQPAGFLCLFPEAVQREAYGTTGDCRMPVVVSPGGTAIAAEGGYRVKGIWDYCSGCDIATHFLGALVILDHQTQSPVGVGYFLFDRADYHIIDNWNVIGMQGTGSRRVVVEERWVSACRMLPMTEARMQEIGPGCALYENPLYHGVPLAVYEFALFAVAVGAARGALDLYEKILREKKWILPPFPVRFEMPELQQRFGDAQALVDTAEAALDGFADLYTEGCRRVFPASEARRIHRAGGQCLELAWQAVDLMFRTGGSSSAAKGSPLGRYFRNVAVIRTHIGAQRDHTSINVARMHFGLPPLSPL